MSQVEVSVGEFSSSQEVSRGSQEAQYPPPTHPPTYLHHITLTQPPTHPRTHITSAAVPAALQDPVPRIPKGLYKRQGQRVTINAAGDIIVRPSYFELSVILRSGE